MAIGLILIEPKAFKLVVGKLLEEMHGRRSAI
jgi:hypothetical protein